MKHARLLAPLALWLTLSASVAPAAPPPQLPAPTDGGTGFHLEPRPAFEDVFGDVESYRKTVDRFTAIADTMQARRDEFARAVQGALAKLGRSDGKPQKRACPESDVAVPYVRALKLGQDYLRSGRELTHHYEQIKELDRLGETVGLTPDYRSKVKHALNQYQQLLVDYREMKVSFHDQLTDELRYASCNFDRLLALADQAGLKEEAWPTPGQPGAPGVGAAVDKVLPGEATTVPVHPRDPGVGDATLPQPQPRYGIFIFIDNSRCATGTHVALDGKPMSDVPPATRASLQTTPGPHDLCLIAEGAKARCGDPGTIRKSYLHEGWTISLRCN